ncbi:MAG: DTW domain-containing protein [Proteobacteria bacterium]|nr:DTW domain-containing protein [Pseudomonadota bacterium]
MSPAAPSSPSSPPRARCLRCRRPASVCYCASLPSIPTTTRVVILQHPRERDMPIGTARMAKLCLPSAELHVSHHWDDHAALRAALGDPARPPILLYPGEGAKNILTEPPAGPVTLVVVDGTWSQAKVLVRDSTILRTLPRYAFAAPELSRYRIRKEPRAEYCSTIEALMHVLGVLERDPPRFRALLAPFEAMIDAQLAAQQRAPKREGVRQLVRGKRSPLVPTMITDALARWADLLCVVGEANAFPYLQDGRAKQPDELVHWLAYRPADGSRFEAVIAPRGELAPSTAFHLQLGADELHAGESPDAALAAFAAFLRPTDVACTWGHHGTTLWGAGGGTLPADRLDLRDATRRRVNRATPDQRVGSLESYARTLGPTTPPIGRGRGGERLAMLAAIVRSWREATHNDG